MSTQLDTVRAEVVGATRAVANHDGSITYFKDDQPLCTISDSGRGNLAYRTVNPGI